VEDDGFGDELTVFWEIEPGTLVLPKATLPTPVDGGFDEPGRLRAFIDAVRWGAIASADARTLQAPFRSGITIGTTSSIPLSAPFRCLVSTC
jgi:hypothetical protein